MNAKLVMFKGDGTRRDFPLRRNRVLIGRTSACDLRIPLANVSRKHCELLLDKAVVKLKDLGSSNGTLHNDQRVQEASLDAGDRITIGPVVFTLVVNGEPTEIEPVRTVVGQGSDTSVPSPEALTLDPSSEDTPGLDDDDDAPIEIDDPIGALDELVRNGAGDSGPIPTVADVDEDEAKRP